MEKTKDHQFKNKNKHTRKERVAQVVSTLHLQPWGCGFESPRRKVGSSWGGVKKITEKGVTEQLGIPTILWKVMVKSEINLNSKSLEQTIAINNSSPKFWQCAPLHGGVAIPCQLPSYRRKRIAPIKGTIVQLIFGAQFPILLAALCYQIMLDNLPWYCCMIKDFKYYQSCDWKVSMNNSQFFNFFPITFACFLIRDAWSIKSWVSLILHHHVLICFIFLQLPKYFRLIPLLPGHTHIVISTPIATT